MFPLCCGFLHLPTKLHFLEPGVQQRDSYGAEMDWVTCYSSPAVLWLVRVKNRCRNCRHPEPPRLSAQTRYPDRREP